MSAPPPYEAAKSPNLGVPYPGSAPTQYNTPAQYGVQPAPGVASAPPPPGYGTTFVPAPPVGGFANNPQQYGTQPGYAAMTPGYPTAVLPPGNVTTTVVVHQPLLGYTKFPVNAFCKHCNANVITVTRAEVGVTTWVIVGGLILFGFWLGCCFIPFCIDDCKDIYHDCPNCHQNIHICKHM